MPALSVDALLCLKDTAEWSADEVYLVAVIARFTPKPQLKTLVAAAADWKGLRAGSRRESDLPLAADFPEDAVCLAVLLEQDGRRDFDVPAVRRKLDADLELALLSFASIRDIGRDEIVRELRTQIAQSVAQHGDDDTALEPATLVRFEPGSHTASAVFGGHDGRYLLRFKRQ